MIRGRKKGTGSLPPLIDTHAHLDEIADLDDAISRARAAGVVAIIAVGQGLASNEKTLEIARRYPGFVFPALGMHPWSLAQEDVDRCLEFIDGHAKAAIAIGEVGLDYHKRVRAVADKDRQQAVFSELLKIAARHDRPALVHSRYAWRDALTLVENAGVGKAVFHWYTGTSSVLREIIERGYFVSATPAVEYHEEHRRAVKEAPLGQLLLETDCPVIYGRGTASEFTAHPADVARSLKGAALLKGVSEEDLARLTTQNAVRLFPSLSF